MTIDNIKYDYYYILYNNYINYEILQNVIMLFCKLLNIWY